MYKQVLDPVSNSLFYSALFALIPIVLLFVLIGGLRIAAHIAAPISLVAALLVAIIVYSMPVGQALDSAAEGAVFGIFPIMWIVWTAIWIYNMTEETGHFAVLRRSFSGVSADQRVQAVIIAFCFGALLEALAGFGTPVAITAVMLVSLGFRPIKAASVALVANTAPVAFGAIAIPIVTLSGLTGLPKDTLGEMVGRQTPILALFVPLVLVGMVDGWRGVRAVWPAALVGGFVFGLMQFISSNYISVEMTDIIASLLSAGSVVLLLRVWHPRDPLLADNGDGREGRAVGSRPAIAGAATADTAHEGSVTRRSDDHPDTKKDIWGAYAPYLIIIVVFSIAQLNPMKDWLDGLTKTFAWPGLDIINAKGKAPSSVMFKFNWANAAGTLLFVSGLLTMLVLRISPARSIAVFGRTLKQLALATITVMSVLALAYVLNQSGQTLSIGSWIAGVGSILALFSGLIGWLGVAVTGSDTSSNSLFGVLQMTAAKKSGLSDILLTAANSSGGVLGKMISPQNLAIGAAAVGLAGKEGDLFRKVIGWSLLMLAIMCVLVYLQSTSVLSWMVPK